jgi:hypothetical protein
MVGAEMFLSTRSRVASMSDRGEPWSTLTERFLPRSLNWPGRFSKILATLIS